MQGGSSMLKRIGIRAISEKTEVTIGEASFPAPFQSGLEFNSPAHGNWNIVHTGMLVPEAQQIYVCADNCMRGVCADGSGDECGGAVFLCDRGGEGPSWGESWRM